LAEVEVVEEVALQKSCVAEGGKLKISGIGLRRGEEVVFGLLGDVTIGENKKGDREKPEKVRDDE